MSIAIIRGNWFLINCQNTVSDLKRGIKSIGAEAFFVDNWLILLKNHTAVVISKPDVRCFPEVFF